jgi:hypothetical protein
MSSELIQKLKELQAKATDVGEWEADLHYHAQKGCMCLSCDFYTGAFVTAAGVEFCDDTEKYRENATDWEKKSGCTQELIPYETAVYAAKVLNSFPAILAYIEELESRQ